MAKNSETNKKSYSNSYASNENADYSSNCGKNSSKNHAQNCGKNGADSTNCK